MKNNFEGVSKRVVIYCICGVILTPKFTGFVCQNPSCPEYMLEKHEHLPERQNNVSNFRTQSANLSGTAASGVSGTYGPINLIDWNREGGEENGSI